MAKENLFAKLLINQHLQLIHLEGKFSKLFVLLLLSLVSGGLFTLLGTLLLEPIVGESMDTVMYSNPRYSDGLKFIQLFSSIGLFVLPGIIFPILFFPRSIKDLKLKRGYALHFFFVVLLLLSFLPLVNWVGEWNSNIQLPEYFSAIEDWMKTTEQKAMDLTKAFLVMNSTTDLIYNILLIGAIPAIGEELIFRGIVQQTVNQNLKNYHIGIWTSAIIFSAIHFQFYGFIPRVILGAFFGYLFVWSGNLWLPIFAHFLNNTTAVLVVYFMGIDTMENELDKIGTTQETYVFSIFSLLLFSFLLWKFRKITKASS